MNCEASVYDNVLNALSMTDQEIVVTVAVIALIYLWIALHALNVSKPSTYKARKTHVEACLRYKNKKDSKENDDEKSVSLILNVALEKSSFKFHSCKYTVCCINCRLIHYLANFRPTVVNETSDTEYTKTVHAAGADLVFT